MNWRIEVSPKPQFPDPIGAGVKSDIRDLGIDAAVEDVRAVFVYMLDGDLGREQVETVCQRLLADGVDQHYLIGASPPCPGVKVVEVSRKPGVTDPVQASTLKGIQDLGLSAESVRTARRYLIRGRLTDEQLQLVATKILANTVIEDVFIDSAAPPLHPIHAKPEFKKVTVAILEADDAELERISRQGQLSLNIKEMKAIQAHYRRLGRNPTDVELETLAQTWSEHCVHKTLKGRIDYNGQIIDNLLASTIARATKELNKPWCVSVFKDNAGVIRFDENHNVCFKVETHNHPSAIEPYGGAGTGIGGVIRDPLGTGLGAKPILNTDIFCFGPPDLPWDKVPQGCLHPKRVMKGVVAGVRDYGNRMGIPTANGAIYFDERYVGNPLVYCGNVGLMPRDKCEKAARKGDLIMVVGGRTGRDGIHGATFSSVELHTESETLSSGAVQIGNAITEKKVVDTLLQARDKGLYSCITDCGAGGLSSAVGEMGEDLGAVVDLEKVPLKYEGLTYTEIWISEAQERMVIAVPPRKLKAISKIFAAEEVEATVIGKFTGDRRLRLRFHGEEVADLDMEFLHHGLPKFERKAVWKRQLHLEPNLPQKADYGPELKGILSSWNVCSKEWVIRQYDHEVQGASVLKPLVGATNDGPGDACVIAPVLGSKRGIIIANGMNPKYGDIDPYWMAAAGIDEALRNIIAVGGNLDQVAILDNFCWGNTDKPDRLGGLVRAAQACYDLAKAYGTPFISGKDSLNNEFNTGTGVIVIPPSLLISAIGVMPDVTKAVSMDAKQPGNLVYIVGLTKPELGGSHYFALHGHVGNEVPKVDAKLGKAVFDALARATASGLVRSCHDCSEGGLAVAAAEMAFAGSLGMDLDLSNVPFDGVMWREDVLLFSESPSRFVVEVAPDRQADFERALSPVPFGLLGRVTTPDRFLIRSRGTKPVISEAIAALKEAWQNPLRW
ncbi:MAG: phosphoribosylformylglycinamidine synthase subunit PurL [Planctomycetes bacterium]|nr:phosphoribosylformylglycinamidine synthase subunit PurL [Planctomycetota bacterium]